MNRLMICSSDIFTGNLLIPVLGKVRPDVFHNSLFKMSTQSIKIGIANSNTTINSNSRMSYPLLTISWFGSLPVFDGLRGALRLITLNIRQLTLALLYNNLQSHCDLLLTGGALLSTEVVITCVEMSYIVT